jgi:hypothetical protein
VLVIVQCGLAWRWDRGFLAKKPALATWTGAIPNWGNYGRDGLSWYGWFRRVRQQSPGACRHVLLLEEIRFGNWQFDVDAALWSELPDHVVVGDPLQVAGWRYPPHVLTSSEAAPLAREACAWRSPDAERRFPR